MKRSRKHLGAKFSEGARLLWEAKEKLQLSIEDVRRRINASSGMVNLWLYGDKRPGLVYANRIHSEFGVDTNTWTLKPSVTFVLQTGQKR